MSAHFWGTPRSQVPWLDLLEVGAGEEPPADGLDRIFARALGGVLLRGVVPEELLVAARARIPTLDAPAAVRVAPVVSHGATPILEVLGRSLRLSPWPAYAAAIEPVRRIHAEIFGHPEGLEPWIRARIAGLARGQAPEPLLLPGGQPLARCLLSTLREGGTLPFHFDNYCFYEATEFARVVPLLDTTTLINALTILEAPVSGGALELVAFDWDEYRATTGRTDSGAWKDVLVAGRAARRVDLRPGDTLVFDAGRIAHQVTPVEGPVPRYSYVWHMGRLRGSSTICTFV